MMMCNLTDTSAILVQNYCDIVLILRCSTRQNGRQNIVERERVQLALHFLPRTSKDKFFVDQRSVQFCCASLVVEFCQCG